MRLRFAIVTLACAVVAAGCGQTPSEPSFSADNWDDRRAAFEQLVEVLPATVDQYDERLTDHAGILRADFVSGSKTGASGAERLRRLDDALAVHDALVDLGFEPLWYVCHEALQGDYEFKAYFNSPEDIGFVLRWNGVVPGERASLSTQWANGQPYSYEGKDQFTSAEHQDLQGCFDAYGLERP